MSSHIETGSITPLADLLVRRPAPFLASCMRCEVAPTSQRISAAIEPAGLTAPRGSSQSPSAPRRFIAMVNVAARRSHGSFARVASSKRLATAMVSPDRS